MSLRLVRTTLPKGKSERSTLIIGQVGANGRSGLAIENRFSTLQVMHVYEVRPRKDKRGAGLISDALPFGCLWYGEPNAVENAI